MNAIAGPFAALTVASIFYCYREYKTFLQRKERRLRDRVTLMLWTMANGMAA